LHAPSAAVAAARMVRLMFHERTRQPFSRRTHCGESWRIRAARRWKIPRARDAHTRSNRPR
jgi:hypothetical protein